MKIMKDKVAFVTGATSGLGFAKVIRAEEINDAWEKVVNEKVRYRYVIDAATI
jgi:NADP-dependent 3-hydroxy acid dehydrogenase YdfG